MQKIMEINKGVIAKLRAEFGDAFYLLDSEQYQKNFLELRDTFRTSILLILIRQTILQSSVKS